MQKHLVLTIFFIQSQYELSNFHMFFHQLISHLYQIQLSIQYLNYLHQYGRIKMIYPFVKHVIASFQLKYA